MRLSEPHLLHRPSCHYSASARTVRRSTAMDIIQTPLPGLIILKPKRFQDCRGFFCEAYSKLRLAEAGNRRGFRAGQSLSVGETWNASWSPFSEGPSSASQAGERDKGRSSRRRGRPQTTLAIVRKKFLRRYQRRRGKSDFRAGRFRSWVLDARARHDAELQSIQLLLAGAPIPEFASTTLASASIGALIQRRSSRPTRTSNCRSSTQKPAISLTRYGVSKTNDAALRPVVINLAIMRNYGWSPRCPLHALSRRPNLRKEFERKLSRQTDTIRRRR